MHVQQFAAGTSISKVILGTVYVGKLISPSSLKSNAVCAHKYQCLTQEPGHMVADVFLKQRKSYGITCLKYIDNIATFRRGLKTFLFRQEYQNSVKDIKSFYL